MKIVNKNEQSTYIYFDGILHYHINRFQIFVVDCGTGGILTCHGNDCCLDLKGIKKHSTNLQHKKDSSNIEINLEKNQFNPKM